MKSPALCLALLLAPAAIRAQEPLVVETDEHRTEIVRAVKSDSLHGGLLQPPGADEAFLLVYLATDDPCFDPAASDGCFDGAFDAMEAIAHACGEIELDGGEVREADGGGLVDGELACSYLVPVSAGAMTLRLAGYPEVGLEPRD